MQQAQYSVRCAMPMPMTSKCKSCSTATQEISALAWHSIAELPSTYEENSQVQDANLQCPARVRGGKGACEGKVRGAIEPAVGTLHHTPQASVILVCIEGCHWCSTSLLRSGYHGLSVAADGHCIRLRRCGPGAGSVFRVLWGGLRRVLCADTSGFHLLCLRASSTLAGFACEPDSQLRKRQGVGQTRDSGTEAAEDHSLVYLTMRSASTAPHPSKNITTVSDVRMGYDHDLEI